MYLRSLFISLAFLAATAQAQNPVPVIDLDDYLGHWFQVYTDAANEDTFENSTYCATADYGLNPNATVSVLNRARIGSATGSLYSIEGWAEPTTNSSYEGEFTVHLQGIDFAAPYWIYQLGPADYNGTQYAYSIVSDPFHWTLFVLARNVSDFNVRFRPQVLEFLATNGWNQSWNSPIEVQQVGCEPF